MANIGIVGSGNVGANAAFFIAEKGVGDVVIADEQEGLSTGKALDMMEAAPVRRYKTKLQGSDSLDKALDSDIVVIAAGAIRKPGGKREDLFDENRSLIETMAGKLRRSQAIVVILTEPVDLMTSLFVQKSGLSRKRVMGIGGVLDSIRLRYALARELGLATDNVAATVIGPHNDQMIPLAAYSSVAGVPVKRLIPEERLTALFDEVRGGGDRILEQSQRSTAFYGPAAAACDVTEAIARNLRRVFPVSFVLEGELGVSDCAMSLPAIIGEKGIELVLEPRLSEEEQKAFESSGTELGNKLQGIA